MMQENRVPDPSGKLLGVRISDGKHGIWVGVPVAHYDEDACRREALRRLKG